MKDNNYKMKQMMSIEEQANQERTKQTPPGSADSDHESPAENGDETRTPLTPETSDSTALRNQPQEHHGNTVPASNQQGVITPPTNQLDNTTPVTNQHSSTLPPTSGTDKKLPPNWYKCTILKTRKKNKQRQFLIRWEDEGDIKHKKMSGNIKEMCPKQLFKTSIRSIPQRNVSFKKKIIKPKL